MLAEAVQEDALADARAQGGELTAAQQRPASLTGSWDPDPISLKSYLIILERHLSFSSIVEAWVECRASVSSGALVAAASRMLAARAFETSETFTRLVIHRAFERPLRRIA